jgi:predicted transcriptional regulator of viral defense system
MKPKTAIQKIRPLITSPSFTSEEARKLGVSAASLAYYVKTRELERLARGVYKGINAPTIDSFQWEDLITAVKQTKSGVVCLVSALALYELTDEIPRQHWIAIPNSTRHRAPRSVRVVRMRNMSLGKTHIKIDNIIIPIFDRERTIIDAFKYLSKEIAIKALKRALTKSKKDKINLETLRSYANALRVNISTYIMAITT